MRLIRLLFAGTNYLQIPKLSILTLKAVKRIKICFTPIIRFIPSMALGAILKQNGLVTLQRPLKTEASGTYPFLQKKQF